MHLCLGVVLGEWVGEVYGVSDEDFLVDEEETHLFSFLVQNQLKKLGGVLEVHREQENQSHLPFALVARVEVELLVFEVQDCELDGLPILQHR